MALFWLLGHIPRAIVRHLLVWLVDLKRGKLRCCRSRLKMIILLLSGWNKDDVHFRFSDEKIQRDSKYYIYMIWIYGDVRGGGGSTQRNLQTLLSRSHPSFITLFLNLMNLRSLWSQPAFIKAVAYSILQRQRIWWRDWVNPVRVTLSSISIDMPVLSQPSAPLITNSPFCSVFTFTWIQLWQELLHKVNLYLANLGVTTFMLKDGFHQFWSRQVNSKDSLKQSFNIWVSQKQLKTSLFSQIIDWLFLFNHQIQLDQWLFDESMTISVLQSFDLLLIW